MRYIQFQDIEIPVRLVEIGMHVVALDIPWSQTNFLLQGFIVKTEDEIEQLRRQCKTITVQVRNENIAKFKARLQWLENNIAKHPQKKSPQTTRDLPKPAPQTTTRYHNKVSFKEAQEQAKEVFLSARQIAHTTLRELRSGAGLDTKNVYQTVSNVVDNVLNNKDALHFLTMIKNKDNYTAEHSMNVCVLSATFARHLGLDIADIEMVALCGLLHDVGKSQIPLEILNKPGRFTQQEANIMAEHTTYGRNLLLAASGDFKEVIEVAHSHHERMDGKGYPRCLTANQISYYSKLVSIVDAYDAMTSQRCYGEAKTSQQALSIIRQNAGTQFDAYLAKQFIASIGPYANGSLVELELGHLAIVLTANDDNPLRPAILVITDAEKQTLDSPNNIDLSQTQNAALKIKREVHPSEFDIDVKNYIGKNLFS